MNSSFYARVCSCEFGHFPWDEWEKAALEKGVPGDLAKLGREVMREAFQHQWTEDLQYACGLFDGGKQMLTLARRSPKRARARWQRWLDSDGLRSYRDPKTGELKP
jgi:hypothetical protein